MRSLFRCGTKCAEPLEVKNRSPSFALPPTGVLGITAVIWVTHLFLGLGLPNAAPVVSAPFSWTVLAILFAVATSAVIHVHFRQESESFDLFDMPVVVGLMLFSPKELWMAQLLGTFVAVAIVRRQPLIKVVFNVGLLGLQTTITAHLFHLAVAMPEASDPAVWGPLFIAIIFGSILNVSFIVAVVSIIEGRLDENSLLHVFTYGGVVTLTNTGLGLIAAVLVTEEIALVLPLVIPVTALFLAYRAYGAERDQRARLEMLYRSTRSLSALGEKKDAIERLLHEASEMFRATSVEFLLIADRPGRTRRSGIINGEITEVLGAIEEGSVETLMEARPEDPQLFHENDGSPWGRYLRDRSITAAMVSKVGNDANDAGVLIVGDRKGDVATFGPEDLRMMGTIVNHLGIAIERERLSESVKQLRRLEESLLVQARSDRLTGLLNRSGFEELIDELTDGEPMAVAFIDLDDFKVVNDTYGHEAGDRVLIAVAEHIRAIIRDGDAVARLGGDEFAILFRETQQPAKTLPRLLAEVTKPITIATDLSVVVGASIGLATGRPNESAPQTVRNADIAMFTAKAVGKNTYQIFSEDLVPIDRRPNIDQELRDAVESDSFALFYQPIVDLASEVTVGFESLLRWRNQSHGLLLPADFLRDAQDTGAIVPIEQWAIHRAAEDLLLLDATWQPVADGSELFVTLNISADHLCRHSAVETLLGRIAAAGLEPSRMMLELSETELMKGSADLSRTLQALRNLGFSVAIDDFGSGDASLGIIKRNNVDAVKIAQSVVAGLSGGERPYLMAMIELARNLDLRLIAEGVETEEQREQLMEAGITLGQGYLFARPLPINEILSNAPPVAKERRQIS